VDLLEFYVEILPVLGNVKRPIEFEVLFFVVVYERATGCVVAASEHAGWGVFFCDLTDGVRLRVCGKWLWKTYIS